MGYYDDDDRYDDEPARRRSRYGYEDDYEDDPYRRRLRYDDDSDRPLKHSMFGIWSFIIALGVGVFEFVLIGIAASYQSRPEGSWTRTRRRRCCWVWAFWADSH
jgi:hypothetical protein